MTDLHEMARAVAEQSARVSQAVDSDCVARDESKLALIAQADKFDAWFDATFAKAGEK